MAENIVDRAATKIAQRTVATISIIGNDKGWEPTREQVKEILRNMAHRGFRTDWWFCLALESRALIFSDSKEDSESLVAIKVRGKYRVHDQARIHGPQRKDKAMSTQAFTGETINEISAAVVRVEAQSARRLCAYHIADRLEYGEDETIVTEVDERDCQQCEADHDHVNDDGRDFTAPYEP